MGRVSKDGASLGVPPFETAAARPPQGEVVSVHAGLSRPSAGGGFLALSGGRLP